jgi:hypothetical protein
MLTTEQRQQAARKAHETKKNNRIQRAVKRSKPALSLQERAEALRTEWAKRERERKRNQRLREKEQKEREKQAKELVATLSPETLESFRRMRLEKRVAASRKAAVTRAANRAAKLSQQATELLSKLRNAEDDDAKALLLATFAT